MEAKTRGIGKSQEKHQTKLLATALILMVTYQLHLDFERMVLVLVLHIIYYEFVTMTWSVWLCDFLFSDICLNVVCGN